MIRIAGALAAVTLLAAGAASAQTAHPATPVTAKAAVATKPAPAAKATTAAPVAHTAASIDCSKQADAKGLHGTARKEFRSSCKAAAKKG